MLDALGEILADDPRIAYAFVFGSSARGEAGPHSDLDVAVGLSQGVCLDALDLGALTARLEDATGRTVDLVLLDEAPPGLAFRIFRDGRPILERSRDALVRRKTRAILEYLDFQPIEELFTRRVLAAAKHGR